MTLTEKFRGIFQKLDERLLLENEEREKSGALSLGPVQIKILGQTALLLGELPFSIAGTMDLDAEIDGDYFAKKVLTEILLAEGIYLDPDSHLVWIPKDAKFHRWHQGGQVTVSIMEHVAVIASKAKFKRLKDKELIRNYLQYFPESKDKLREWGISVKWAF